MSVIIPLRHDSQGVWSFLSLFKHLKKLTRVSVRVLIEYHNYQSIFIIDEFLLGDMFDLNEEDQSESELSLSMNTSVKTSMKTSTLTTVVNK